MCGTCTCVSHICSRLSTVSHWKVLLQSYSNHSSELFHLFWSQLRINEFHFCSLVILLHCRCLWWRCRSNLQDLYSPGDPFTITPMLLNCFTILRSSKNPSNIRRCVSLKDLGTCGEKKKNTFWWLCHYCPINTHTDTVSRLSLVWPTLVKLKSFKSHLFPIQTDLIFQLMSSSTSVPNEVAS